jgi:hypothetical protein
MPYRENGLRKWEKPVSKPLVPKVCLTLHDNDKENEMDGHSDGNSDINKPSGTGCQPIGKTGKSQTGKGKGL